MSLEQYNQKRNFKKTSEPAGKEKSSKSALRFVVQKHDASAIHYDFRLEMEGVLKSWAVPKGPSLNPADKRLAMMVEDHPFDYRNFEGVIPEGEYGGGTVIVWDEGTYQTSDEADRKKGEKTLLTALRNGKLDLVLSGQKLAGAFTLIKMKGRGERSWVLIKKKDEWSTTDDVTQNEASVKSSKTIPQIAEENGVAPNHPEAHGGAKASSQKKDKTPATKKKTPVKKEAAKKQRETAHSQGSLPAKLTPMLATLVNQPFDDKNWIFEVKWDGYRTLAYCQGKSVELISRNLKPFTAKYTPIAKALAGLGLHAVLDGEIVAVDEKGLVHFQALQNWQNTPVQLQLYVFDILWADGKEVTHQPLSERKKILKQLLPKKHAVIKYSDHVTGKGKAYFEKALQLGLEGIMAKRANSIYLPGSRTPDWVKIKVAQRQEVVIAGYTQPRNSRKYFGSLLLGVYQGKELVYVGHTGSGFDTLLLKELYEKLQPLVTEKPAFMDVPKTNMPATWVKPQLVCEIKFTEWTADRMARHPIFMGLRTDKKAKDVVFEKAVTLASIKTDKQNSPAKATGSTKKEKGSEPAKQNLELQLNGETLQLTNLQKLYWKKEGFSKGDVLNYYRQVASYMLPYLKDRPHSLNRHPNGIDAPNFFQKDVSGKVPDWIETHEDFSESTGVPVEYLVCRNEATLLYMANLGCIEINPWHSRTNKELKPDWCLLDLDPDESNNFDQVVDVAQTIRKILESVGVAGYAKTSGSTGIHIYLPLAAKYSFEQSKTLAETIVILTQKELPNLTSLERSPAKRKGKIYLDFLQNKETQTAAAPYSLRPKPGVPVSTPLDWSEVKKGLTPKTWNAYNIMDRIKTEGDLFSSVLGKAINLEKALKSLQSLLK